MVDKHSKRNSMDATSSIILNSEKIRIKGKIGKNFFLGKGSGNFGNVFFGVWNNKPVALKNSYEKVDKLIEEGLLLQ